MKRLGLKKVPMMIFFLCQGGCAFESIRSPKTQLIDFFHGYDFYAAIKMECLCKALLLDVFVFFSASTSPFFLLVFLVHRLVDWDELIMS
jgi:hypothetical protein